MNVWTIQPRCAGCRRRQDGTPHDHKISCAWLKGWYWGSDLPKRDPSRSIHRPWLAKWPTEWRREKEVKTTWHVLPSRAIVHVTDSIHIFNDSDHNAHVELTSTGELHVKKLAFGRLIIGYTDPNGE